MKVKFYLILITSLSSLCVFNALSANLYWYGQTSDEWNNPLNWSTNNSSFLPSPTPPRMNDVIFIGNNRKPDFLGFDPSLPLQETIISQLILGYLNNDKGALTVNSGTTLKTSDSASRMTGADGDTSIMLGLNKGAYGELHINGGEVIAKDRVTVGDYGNGLLEVTNGGKFYIGTNGYSVGNLLIGWNHNNAAFDPSQGQGRVVVSGLGSSIITGQKDSAGLRVGQAGQGWLDILNGGSLVTQNIGLGNNTSKSFGEVTVKSNTSDISTLESRDYLNIGAAGTGRLLIGKNGSVLINNKISVGGGGGSESNKGEGNGYVEIDEGTLKIKNQDQVLALGIASTGSAKSYGELVVRNGGLLDASRVIIADALQATAKVIFGGKNGDGIQQLAGLINSEINFGLGQGELVFDQSNPEFVFNNVITSSSTGSNKGKIVHESTNLTAITRDNSNFTGTTEINHGTLSFGNGGSTGYLNGQVIINDDGHLMINHNNNFDFTNYFAGNGTFIQGGSGTTNLLLTDSSNNFTGKTRITEGTLKLGDGSNTFQNSLMNTTTIDSLGTLLFSHGSNAHLFLSQLKGTGNVVKQDNNILSFNADNSEFSGLIKINDGVIKSLGKNTLGGINTDYLITDKGTLNLIGYESELGEITNSGHIILNSLDTTTLKAKSLTQNKSGVLDISLDKEGQPVIEAENVKLAGTLNVTGFNASDNTPSKSSEIDNKSYLLIQSINDITSSFDDVDITELPLTTEDFLTDGRLELSADKKQLWLQGLRLAWNFGGQEENRGSFTINECGSFEVDEVLADQSDNGADWDGKTLTKKGSGTLILSDINTYSGGTNILGGTLQISQDENLGLSNGLVTLGDATLRIVDDFVSSRNILLDNTKSTIDTSNRLVSLSGKLSGNGDLNKIGEGALLLDGDITYQGDTNVKEGTLSFLTNTSNLQGDLSVAQTVYFNHDFDMWFNGSTLGFDNQIGTAVKENSNRLILLGEKNELNWLVNKGELQINALDFSGKVQLASSTGLIINQEDQSKDALFKVQLNSDDNSYIQKIGAGNVLFKYDDNTNLGNVIVSNGELQFESSNETQKNVLNIKGDYTTESGASSVISGATSYFDIAGKLTQQENSKLTVALDFNYCDDITQCEADIHASEVELGGELYVSGFRDRRPEGGDVVKASEIQNVFYQLINSDTEIVGDFANDPSLENAKFGFLLYKSAFSDDRKTFYIDDLALAWNEGGKKHGSGDFNLGTGTAFDLDLGLSDQNLPIDGFDSSWDGKSLTKLGLGELILSAENHYTGHTSVNAGRLTLAKENTISSSHSVSIAENAELFSTSGQILHRLSGERNSKLHFALDETGTLNVVQDLIEDNTEFAGELAGNGDFLLTGSGTLTLSGELNYTGNTYIDSGHLILNGKYGKADFTGDIFGKLGSQFSLIEGAKLTGIIDPTDLFVDNKSSWNMTGDSLLNLVRLGGTINIGNSNVESLTPLKLTTKDWVGNGGVVNLRTVLEDDSSISDLIVLTENGRAQGKTFLNIINIGGLGAQTEKGILIVDANAAGAQTDSDAFSLYSRVAAGAFEYNLRRQDENAQGQSWYLVSKSVDGEDNIRDEVSLYAKADWLIKHQGFDILPKYYDRTASYVMRNSDDPFWSRIYTKYSTSGSLNHGKLIDPETSGSLGLIQIGKDLYSTEDTSSNIYKFGLFSGVSFNHSRVSGFNQTNIGGTVTSPGYTFGFYNTYDSESFYLDSILQGTYYPDIRMQSRLSGLVKSTAEQFGGSVELGSRLYQTSKLLFEPQAQIYFQKTNIEDAMDPYAKLKYGNHSDILLRTGLRLSAIPSKSSENFEFSNRPKNNAWIELNYFEQLNGNTELDISDSADISTYKIAQSLNDKWMAINIGYTNQITERLNLFFDIDASHSLSSTDYMSIGVNGGLKYSF